MSTQSQQGCGTVLKNSILTIHKGLVINYGEGGGGLQNGKIGPGVRNFLCLPPPPPQDRVKLFVPPLLKSGNFTRPSYNMTKISSYHVKTTPKLFVPPLSEWLKLFLPSPPFFVGVKLHVPPPRN